MQDVLYKPLVDGRARARDRALGRASAIEGRRRARGFLYEQGVQSAQRMQLHPNNSDCKLYVRRTGILAAVGHDLELCVREYRVEVATQRDAGGEARGCSERARGVRSALGACGRCGRRRARAPSGRALGEGQGADRCEHRRRDPEGRALSTDRIRVDLDRAGPDRYAVRARLTLTGQTREITLVVLREGSDLRVDFTLHQPDFAIAPFRALGGALRLAPDVRLNFSARGAADLLLRP